MVAEGEGRSVGVGVLALGAGAWRFWRLLLVWGGVVRLLCLDEHAVS